MRLEVGKKASLGAFWNASIVEAHHVTRPMAQPPQAIGNLPTPALGLLREQETGTPSVLKSRSPQSDWAKGPFRRFRVKYLDKEVLLTGLGIAVTLAAVIMTDLQLISAESEETLALWSYLAVVNILVLGNLAYQFARFGFMRRRTERVPIAREQLEEIYEENHPRPRLCILIPSYREQVRVLWQTVVSAALLEYPNRRIVVLIDDPPSGSNTDSFQLAVTRRLVSDLNDRFGEIGERLRLELESFLVRERSGACDRRNEALRAAELYEEAATWLEQLFSAFDHAAIPAFAHSDRLLKEKVVLALAAGHRERAASLRQGRPDLKRIGREYRRLAGLLSVDVTSFERKQYANLSHRPNKAMNLNSYMGLMGKSFRAIPGPDLPLLQQCEAAEADLNIPPADYLLTLDADSMVLPDYALKLVRLMEENPRVAVAQTPYSAVPNATAQLERIAGATTDVQYVVHQGLTAFNATYWVGANAILRWRALQDIQKISWESGHPISVFVQDRTVIEDTGSTIDLVRRGWMLYNHPERLAYSATPADFGALVIQRRRWANGGLIIFADLVRYALGVAQKRPSVVEILMRAHYLCSPALGNFCLLLLLLFPFDHRISTIWLPLTAVPYYLLYGRDLRQSGYRWADLPRVYSLNLLLVPVNLAGVLRSIQQMCTGRKAAFGRTPKIENRTAVPSVHLSFLWILTAYLIAAVIIDTHAGQYWHAIFSAANVAFLTYGLSVYVGWQEIAGIDPIAMGVHDADARNDSLSAITLLVATKTVAASSASIRKVRVGSRAATLL